MKKISKITLILLIICLFGTTITLYGCDKVEKTHFEEDMEFEINKADILGINLMDLTELIGNKMSLIDANNSYILFKADGTFQLRLSINPDVISLVNLLLPTINIGSIDFNFLEEFTAMYISPIVPGFSLDNIADGFGLLDTSVGIKVLGLDSVEGTELMDKIQNKESLGNIKIPTNIGIEINSVYNIETFSDSYGKEYTAIYVGNYNPKETQETFFMFSLYKDNNDIQRISSRVEIVEIELEASEI